jgi:hypothetical protein
MSYMQPANPASNNKALNQITGFYLLLLVSAVVVAQNDIYTEVPESYRTPLSEMIYEGHTDWRAAPEEDNPWRENEEASIKPRIKAEFFPTPDYSKPKQPEPGKLFQNEDELEKPRTNIFKYTF